MEGENQMNDVMDAYPEYDQNAVVYVWSTPI